KEMFLNHLYGGMDEPEVKIIDVFICKLRKKLATAAGGKNFIETVLGRGYVLREGAPDEDMRETAEAAPSDCSGCWGRRHDDVCAIHRYCELEAGGRSEALGVVGLDKPRVDFIEIGGAGEDLLDLVVDARPLARSAHHESLAIRKRRNGTAARNARH